MSDKVRNILLKSIVIPDEARKSLNYKPQRAKSNLQSDFKWKDGFVAKNHKSRSVFALKVRKMSIDDWKYKGENDSDTSSLSLSIISSVSDSSVSRFDDRKSDTSIKLRGKNWPSLKCKFLS